MILARCGAAVLLATLVGTVPGCKRLQEKQALRKYAKYEGRVAAARAKVLALDHELSRQGAGGDVARLRPLLKERYLPAYRAWVATLRSLPAGTDRLRRIRGALLKALERGLEAHEGFADGLPGANIQETWAGLVRVRQSVAEAEARYRADLDTYYREHDLRRSIR